MDPLVEKLAGGIITALVAVIGVLWAENNKWRERFLGEQMKRLEDQAKRLEDLKEHGRTSEMFRRALERKRNEYSEPPPPSR